MFNQDSFGTILKAVINIHTEIAGHAWYLSPVDKMETIMKIELENLYVLTSPKPELMARFGNEKLRNQLHNCLHNHQCQRLQELLKHLGDYNSK